MHNTTVETIQYERKQSYIKKILTLGKELCKAFGHKFDIEYVKDTSQINLLGKVEANFYVDILCINGAIIDISNNKKLTKEVINYLEDLHNSYEI